MAEQNSSKKGTEEQDMVSTKEYDLETLKLFFEESPMLVCLLSGPEHRVVYVNKKLRNLYRNREIPFGTPAREAWPELMGQGKGDLSIFDRMNKIYEIGEPYIVNESKVYFDRSNTGTFEEGYFNFAYQPLKDKNGQVQALFLTGREVTKRVKTRKARDRFEKRFQIAVEGAKLGFFEVDAKGESFNFLSDQAKLHLGYSPEDTVTYEQYYKSLHPDDISKVRAKAEEAVEEDVLYEVDCRIFWPDNSLHWLLVRGYAITDENGVPERRIGIVIDITHQKETEQRLKDAVRVRDDFLSIASHELQTPITSLKTRAELLEMGLKKDGQEKYATEAAKITEQIDQLARLSDNLLDISRISEGKLSLEKEVFAIGDLIHESADTMQHISHHSIEINEGGEYQVYADKYRIGQILTNLIGNAIKYSPEADKIVIDTRQEGDNIFVSVTDFGIGISESDQKKVFDRFFRGSGSVKNSYPGIGIGLYISAEIIERHNGSIKVESNDGRGSVFTFSLAAANLN